MVINKDNGSHDIVNELMGEGAILEESVEWIDLPMTAGRYLTDILVELPHGLIQKTATGTGATTLEFTCSRSSLIVFPTRALAISKAIKQNSYYFGGKNGIIDIVAPEKILKDIHQKKKIKIAVVADSLKPLVDALGDVVFSYFYLTIDEADCLQTEVDYRPVMEDVLDIYCQFPEKKRTMISATLTEFNDPRLRSEQRFRIDWRGQSWLPIDLYYTREDPVIHAAAKIRDVYKSDNKTKILVAFNSVAGIIELVELLKNDLPESIGVLCGEKSREHIPAGFEGHVIEGKLQSHITFITSAFFYGIDFEEELNTIIVTDLYKPHTLLSESKVRQILGRARKGTPRKIFIFNTYGNRKDERFEIADRNIDAIAKSTLGLITMVMSNEFFSEGYKEQICNSILNESKINGLRLLIKRNGEIELRSLIIDYLKIEQEKILELYKKPEITADNFTSHFSPDLHYAESIEGGDDRELVRNLRDQTKMEAARRAQTFLSKLQDPKALISIVPKTRIETRLVEIVDLVNGDQFIRNDFFHKKIEEATNPKLTLKSLNSIYRLALSYIGYPKSDLWRYLNMEFENNVTYSGAEIYIKLGTIKDTTGHPSLGLETFSKTTAVTWFNQIYRTHRDNRAFKGENGYRIQCNHSQDICVL